jgi:hypothetical protein
VPGVSGSAARALPSSVHWAGWLTTNPANGTASVCIHHPNGYPQEISFAGPGKREAELRQAVASGATLWRLSLPQTAAPLAPAGEQLVEWGGAQRWLVSSAPAAQVRSAVSRAGGHATAYLGPKTGGALGALSAPLMRIHRDLKTAFDPDRVFNPGRLYADL